MNLLTIFWALVSVRLVELQDPNASLTYEEHSVTTADGYNLKLNRIYNNSTQLSKYPVLLSHGLLTNGYDWVLSGKPKSISFELADSDQDVWMLNSREDPKFYNFSFHEIASIDFILNKTGNNQVNFVGFSQGGAAFLAMASTIPEMNAKIQSAHLLDLLIRLVRSVPIIRALLKPSDTTTMLANVPGENPAKYNLRLVTAPVYLYYSDRDSTTSMNDVNKLAIKLGNVRGKFLIRNYSHDDFLYTKDVVTEVYDKIIKSLY